MRSSIGAGYRAPSAIEQFVHTYQFGVQVLPNPALQGEQSWSAEIGTSAVLWNALQIDAAVFGSRYTNLIGPAPVRHRFLSLSSSRTSPSAGGRDSTWAPMPPSMPSWLNVRATFLYLDSKDLDTGLPLPYRSAYNVTGTVTTLEGARRGRHALPERGRGGAGLSAGSATEHPGVRPATRIPPAGGAVAIQGVEPASTRSIPTCRSGTAGRAADGRVSLRSTVSRATSRVPAQRIRRPNALVTSPTHRSAVRFIESSTGLISTMSIDTSLPASATISMARCASR